MLHGFCDLSVSCVTDHVTSAEARNHRTQHAVGRHEDLLDYSEETEAEVERACLPVTRPGTDRLARHCEGSKNDKGTGGKTTSESGQDWTFQGL